MLFFSCKKNNHTSSDIKTINNDSENIKIEFDFYSKTSKQEVDKIYVDSTYLLLIDYENKKMDRFNKKIFEDNPNRYLYFYLGNNDENLSEKDLTYFESNIKFDTFYAVNNREIPVFDIKFKKSGINYINGIIDDFVYIKLKDTSKLRRVSKKIGITKELIVNVLK